MGSVSSPEAKRGFIVAVDGPAGSGKSYVCKRVSHELGLSYVNTGFLYRTLGLLATRKHCSLEDSNGLIGLIDIMNRDLVWSSEEGRVWVEAVEMTSELGTDELGQKASKVALDPLVRRGLLPLQRKMALEATSGAIVDGRDIGTVVFPQANVKVFLTASLEARAKRRLKQLLISNPEVIEPLDLARIKESIQQRDMQDSNRASAPLSIAADAVSIDTSSMNPDEVVSMVIELISKKLKEGSDI